MVFQIFVDAAEFLYIYNVCVCKLKCKLVVNVAEIAIFNTFIE